MRSHTLTRTDFPQSPTEHKRLQLLAQLDLLDTPEEPSFEAIVDTAKQLIGAPICLVSIVDKDRQWFKAKRGMNAAETPRETAFCNYVVASNHRLEVPDATKDQRFSANPLVVGDPGIRSYAGVPIFMSEGYAAGTICVLDTQPRALDPQQWQALQSLADLASALLESRRAVRKVVDLSGTLVRQTEQLERQSQRLAEQKRILDAASKELGMGAWEIDLATEQLTWSDGMYELHELPSSVIPSSALIEACYQPRDRKRLRQVIQRSRETQSDYVFEGQMSTAKGGRKWVRVVSKVARANGVPVKRYGFKLDITRERASIDRILHLSEHDSLTGLFNREALNRRLAELCAQEEPVTLLLIDLDGFKGINDAYGHPVGDACLLNFARCLSRFNHRRRMIARLGGDEFAVLLAGADDQSSAPYVAKAIIDNLARPVEVDGKSLAFSASVGLASRNKGHDATPTQLVREADLALYSAKENGRNRVATFLPELAQQADQKRRVVEQIRQALRRGELQLFYQAKIDLGTGDHLGFEALLRWKQTDGSFLSPVYFRPALEDPSLGVDIGKRVFQLALDQMETWREQHLDFGHVAINVGLHQFRDANLCRHLLSEVTRRHLTPAMIEIEVTEDVFLGGQQQVLQLCKEMRDAGFRLSFDDFGTGFASLAHLSQYPMSTVKIDRSFVSAANSPASQSIIRSICDMASNFGMEVVAEGIETEDQLQFLRSVGCHAGQGYLFHQPEEATGAIKAMTARPVRSRNVLLDHGSVMHAA